MSKPIPDYLEFVVPLVPPSVNHYKVRFRNGRTVVSDEATVFKGAVIFHADRGFVVGRTFAVTIIIVLGKGKKGDIDNFPKLVLDGLADANVFHKPNGKVCSDAHVRILNVALDSDTRPEHGSTRIIVAAIR